MITVDLNFQGIPGAIASYIIPHAHGVILIESGPGSTIPALLAGLHQHGFTEKDISAVFLTHIHLDHAGAAGWLARQGANIYVHPAGAPHLLNPEKLLNSARRVYGEQLESLWGEFLPVPEERLTVINDADEIEIDGLHLRALETPGHAAHHHAYFYKDTCFSGDVCGIRLAGMNYLSIPMVPPEFILENWRTSVQRLQAELAQGGFSHLAPTHFGVFSDPAWHLAALVKALDNIEAWMQATMPTNPDDAHLMDLYTSWVDQQILSEGIPDELVSAYKIANPPFISVAGIQRYWRKFRVTE